MKRAYRTIAGFLVVIMMASSFPVLAVTESVWDNDSSMSSQVETTMEDSATFGDDASDTSSHQPNVASEQEDNASIGDASDSNEESTKQQLLDEQECDQSSFGDAQVKEPDVDTGNEPTGKAISTAQQLQAIGTDDISLDGSYYLTCDIDLAQADQLPDDPNNNFTAIGTRSMPFTGSFDGNGHEIQNLQISTETNYQGLFGCVGNNAVVTNVGVTGSVSGMRYIGGIAGCIQSSGSVTNCYNTAKVGDIFELGGPFEVGGVVGWAYGRVTNCYNTGTVEGDASVGGIVGEAHSIVKNCYNTGDVTGGTKVGGVVGSLYENVTDCYNTAIITGKFYHIGGVVGNVAGNSIMNCYNIGEVIGPKCIGGVAGYAYQVTVMNCYYNRDNRGQATEALGEGKIDLTVKELTLEEMTGPQALTNMVFTSTEGTWMAANKEGGQPNAYGDSSYYFPQLAVFVTDASDPSQFPQQTVHDFAGHRAPVNAYISTAQQLQAMNHQPSANYVLLNDIDLSLDDQLPDDQNNNFTAIGTRGVPFTGKFDGAGHVVKNLQISNAADYQGLFGYIGENAVVTSVGVTGSVSAKNYVGGVAGVVYGSVTNCYNTAAVTADSFVGGFAGCIYKNARVTNCYNTGEVIGSDMYGAGYVGGIAGYLDGRATNCYSIAAMIGSSNVGGLVGDVTSKGSITDCYCLGKVTGSNNVGNLVGNTLGKVENCYYNIELTDPSVPDFGISTGFVTNSGAKYTMQMTGSNAIGADGMQFSDASAWKTTENTDSLAYYPGLSTIETEQPISKPYYNISFDVDPDCTLEADGFDPNGTVVEGGHYVFKTSHEDVSIPMQVLLNGTEIAPIETEGNTSTFMIDNVTSSQQVAVVFTQKINGLQISGADTMECGTTQTLTLTFDPGNLTTGNKAVTWSVVEGSTGDVTFSEQTSDNVVIEATQVGNVTVRATSKIDETVYDDFAITIIPAIPSVVFPTQAIIDYGQPLSEATFVGGEGEGTFQFEDKDHVAVDEDNGVSYTAIFTPTDAESYEPLKEEVPLTIRLQITNVSISTPVENRNPSTDELLVMKDSYQQFASEMQGHGVTAENSLVDWSVTGAESPETVIDQTGKLSISKDETAKVLHISITAKADPTKTAEERVIVCERGDFDGTMVVNAMDANLLLRQIQQAQQPDYLFNPFYDLNHDNVIDVNDYVEFLKILDGK